MRSGIKKIILGTGVLLVLLLYFFLDARKGGFLPCPFFLLTGWHCPGCGSQRALSSLLHGNIAEALHYNFLLMLFLPLLICSALFSLRGLQPVKLWYSPVFVKIVLALIIVFGVVRNIPVSPFSLMAP